MDACGYGDGRLRAPSYRGTYEDFICARRVPARSRSGDRAAGHGDHHRRRHRSDRRRLARSDGHGARARIGLEAATLTNVGVYLISPVPIGTYDVEGELQGFRRAVTRSLEVHAGDHRPARGARVGGAATAGARELRAPSGDRDARDRRSPGKRGELSDADAADRRRDAGHGASRPDGRLQRERPPRAAEQFSGRWNRQQLERSRLQNRQAQVLIPSLDAVREFKVSTSNYSAELAMRAR